MTERSAQALGGDDSQNAGSPPPAESGLTTITDGLVGEIFAGARILGLIGAASAGRHAVLDLLAARLAGSRRTLRIEAGILFPDELAPRLLGELRAPSGVDACAAFEAQARALASEGQMLVLEIEDGDSLLPQTAHWLADLTAPPQPAIQMVVACQLEPILRRSFPPEIGPIEVARLGENAKSESLPPPTEPPQRTYPTAHEDGEATASDELRIEFISGDLEPLVIVPEPRSEEDPNPQESVSGIGPRPAPTTRTEGPAATPPARCQGPSIDEPTLVIVDRASGGTEVQDREPTRREGRESDSPPTDAAAIPRERAIEGAPLGSRRARRRVPTSIAVLSIGITGVLCLSVIYLLLSRAPTPTSPEEPTLHQQEEVPAPSRAGRTPVARSSAQPAEAPGRGEASAATERLDVHYDADTERIRVAARGVPLRELLTAIAGQTGMHLESELDLSENVDWHFEDASLEEALDRLLGGYHIVALDDSKPGEASPRSVWILTQRSTAPPLSQAVELLLRSNYASRRLDAARRLEQRGSAGVAFALVDALERARTRDDSESQFLGAVQDRVTDDLCRSWGGSARGSQGMRLRCP